MKIAYLVPSLINRGPIIVVRDLVTVMTVNGHQCMVYYFDESDAIDISCPVKKISIRNIINFNDFDVVHSHGIRPDLYVFLHKPLFCTAICVSTMHNFVFEDLASQYNKLIAFMAGKFWMKILGKHDKVVVLTKIALEYYERVLPTKKLEVVYNTRTINIDDKLTSCEQEEILKFKEGDLCLGINAMLSPIKCNSQDLI